MKKINPVYNLQAQNIDFKTPKMCFGLKIISADAIMSLIGKSFSLFVVPAHILPLSFVSLLFSDSISLSVDTHLIQDQTLVSTRGPVPGLTHRSWPTCVGKSSVKCPSRGRKMGQMFISVSQWISKVVRRGQRLTWEGGRRSGGGLKCGADWLLSDVTP